MHSLSHIVVANVIAADRVRPVPRAVSASLRHRPPPVRGRAAYAKIHEILQDIEREWIAELGPTQFRQLKELLLRVWQSPLIR